MIKFKKPLTKEDEKKAIKLINDAFGKQKQSDIDDLTTQKPKSLYSYRESNVILHKNKTIGIFGLYSAKDNPKNVTFVGWFVIDPEYRNKGIGSMSLNKMEKRAKQIGKDFLYVVADKTAKSFYFKKGFKKSKAEKLKNFYYPEDCVLLFKRLR